LVATTSGVFIYAGFLQGSGRAKEGFRYFSCLLRTANDLAYQLTNEHSLFGLLNRTVTKSGGCMLRRWMLTPLVSGDQINERLAAVSFFTEAENDELRQLLVTSSNVS
jgi:DNA mismatch repair ATPase MutS